MPTEARIRRVRQVLSRRQPDLHLIFEELANPHNASAVLRTCDAVGVLHVHYISSADAFPVNKAISTRADKWVVLHRHASMAECVAGLKAQGFQVAATCLAEDARPYDTLDFTLPTAVIFGNESEGITTEAVGLADVRLKVPMLGMVQSLNLSVSVGVVLYEALRQRRDAGLYDRRRLSDAEFDELSRKWLSPGEE